jgi:hypothetical protein
MDARELDRSCECKGEGNWNGTSLPQANLKTKSRG